MRKKIKKKRGKVESQVDSKKAKKEIRKKRTGKLKKEKNSSSKIQEKQKIYISVDGNVKQRFVSM